MDAQGAISSSAERELLAAPRLAWPTVALALLCAASFAGILLLGVSGRGLAGPQLLLAVVLQTVLAFWAFTPMHDASHRAVAAHPRLRPLNELVGWLCGAPLLAPFPAFRHLHLQHHKHTNDPARDPDHYSGRGSSWTRPLRWLTQDLHYYRRYLQGAAERPRGEARQVVLGLVAFYGAALSLALLGHGAAVLLLWLLPARLATALLAYSFDYLPHRPHDVLGSADRLRATAVLEHRFLTPLLLSQNYHLVHHLYPGVPFYRYGRLWWAQRERLVSRGALVRRLWPARAGQRASAAPAPAAAGPRP